MVLERQKVAILELLAVLMRQFCLEKDKLLECTLDGELYQVQGYEEEDRVCIYYKTDMPLQEPTYARIVFDCLNDICVYKGE